MYKVVFTAKARKQLIELPRLVAKRIIERIAKDLPFNQPFSTPTGIIK